MYMCNIHTTVTCRQCIAVRLTQCLHIQRHEHLAYIAYTIGTGTQLLQCFFSSPATAL